MTMTSITNSMNTICENITDSESDDGNSTVSTTDTLTETTSPEVPEIPQVPQTQYQRKKEYFQQYMRKYMKDRYKTNRGVIVECEICNKRITQCKLNAHLKSRMCQNIKIAKGL